VTPDRDTYELHTAYFRLLGADQDYQRIVKEVLRPQWRATGLRPSHPGRFDLEQLQAAVKDGTADAALRRYVAAVERFVSGQLRLNDQRKPAKWACGYVHSMVVPPAYVPAAIGDDAVVSVPAEKWVGAESPPELTWDDGALALRVSAIGAVVTIPGREDTISCRPPEWGSFDRWDQFGRLAHELLDIELARLREAFEQRYKGSFKNRPAVADDHTILLPVLFRFLYHREPRPPEISRDRLKDFADRVGVDLPRR
jgi:hypothetical protein